MALDPSLSLQVQPIQVPDTTNMLAKALQLKTLMGQDQLQGLQIQSTQASADETNRLRQLFADPTTASLDPNALRTKIMGAAPIAGQPILKSMLDTQKTQGEITQTNLANEHAQIVATGSLLGAAAQMGPQAVIDAITKSPTIPESQRQPLLQQAQADPVAFAKNFALRTMTPEQQAQLTKPQFLPTEAGIAAVQPTIDGSPATGYMVGDTGAASSRTGQPGVGPGIPSATQGAPGTPVAPQRTPEQQAAILAIERQSLVAGMNNATDAATKTAYQNAIAQIDAGQAQPSALASPGMSSGAGVQPQGGTFGPAQVAGSASTGALPALGAKPSGTWEVDPLTGQRVYAPKFATPGDTLNPNGAAGLSDQDKQLAKSIANLDLAPMNGMALRNPRNAAIMAEVYNQNPQYDATDYQAKQTALRNFSPSGQAGKTLRSLSVADDHLDTLQQAGTALQNGQYPIVNKIANAFNVQTGGTSVGSFNAVKQIVGDEVVKAVLGGAGGVGDRDAIQKTIDAAKTPQDLSNVIAHYRTLMAAQKEALLSDYQNQTGRTDAATRFNYKSNAAAPTAPAGWNLQVVSQ